MIPLQKMIDCVLHRPIHGGHKKITLQKQLNGQAATRGQAEWKPPQKLNASALKIKSSMSVTTAELGGAGCTGRGGDCVSRAPLGKEKDDGVLTAEAADAADPNESTGICCRLTS
eukprot:GHVT01033828.1.p3 GENE.GHVT01033828.1~~GHVT01033828.1.p3  ORF type:complete len:115 (-),score=18.57 GHVT01033828.1:2955-3299(-)